MIENCESLDHYCSLLMRRNSNHPWILVASSETIQNNLSPNWRTQIEVEYEFHKPLELKFEVRNENLAG